MIIKGLTFKLTCRACPEQYDVFDSSGKQVGYIRLRWGEVTCYYPKVFGEILYSSKVSEDSLRGDFENEEQRTQQLTIMAERILERIEKSKIAKVSDIIGDLQAILEQYGDIDVYAHMPSDNDCNDDYLVYSAKPSYSTDEGKIVALIIA